MPQSDFYSMALMNGLGAVCISGFTGKVCLSQYDPTSWMEAILSGGGVSANASPIALKTESMGFLSNAMRGVRLRQSLCHGEGGAFAFFELHHFPKAAVKKLRSFR